MSELSNRFLGINQYYGELMCLAQEHNTVPPVKIEPSIARFKSDALPLRRTALPYKQCVSAGVLKIPVTPKSNTFTSRTTKRKQMSKWRLQEFPLFYKKNWISAQRYLASSLGLRTWKRSSAKCSRQPGSWFWRQKDTWRGWTSKTR